MAEKKRFKSQTLNSEDYEKTEIGAKLVIGGSKVVIATGVFVLLAKKYGPSVLKGIKKQKK